MPFLRISLFALSIHGKKIVYVVAPIADICRELKAIRNATTYAPYLRWSRHGEKSHCPVQLTAPLDWEF